MPGILTYVFPSRCELFSILLGHCLYGSSNTAYLIVTVYEFVQVLALTANNELVNMKVSAAAVNGKIRILSCFEGPDRMSEHSRYPASNSLAQVYSLVEGLVE